MSKLAEAYKEGRAQAVWTSQEILIMDKNKLKACAIGAIGLGLGILSEIDASEDGMYFDTSDKARSAFESMLSDEHIPYNCDHPYYGKTSGSVADVIEHYSDQHRNGRGRDNNLIALLDKYSRN
jgi:hypothetical protein